MSSYFDKANSEIAQLLKEGKPQEALAREKEVVGDCLKNTERPGFPPEFTAKIKAVVSQHHNTKESNEWMECVGYSTLVEHMHEAYHELATKHRPTWRDNPVSNNDREG